MVGSQCSESRCLRRLAKRPPETKTCSGRLAQSKRPPALSQKPPGARVDRRWSFDAFYRSVASQFSLYPTSIIIGPLSRCISIRSIHQTARSYFLDPTFTASCYFVPVAWHHVHRLIAIFDVVSFPPCPKGPLTNHGLHTTARELNPR